MDNSISDVQKMAIGSVLFKGKQWKNLVKKALRYNNIDSSNINIKNLSFNEALKVIRYLNSVV